MNDQKQIMNIFAQAYQLLAKASKQQPSQEGFQQILEILGEDGIQECAKLVDQGPEAVAQAMVQIIQQKSAQKAANGAKLRYIMQLQGKCQPGYLKKGGRCKPCEMANGIFNHKADLFNKGGDVKELAKKEPPNNPFIKTKQDSTSNIQQKMQKLQYPNTNKQKTNVQPKNKTLPNQVRKGAEGFQVGNTPKLLNRDDLIGRIGRTGYMVPTSKPGKYPVLDNLNKENMQQLFDGSKTNTDLNDYLKKYQLQDNKPNNYSYKDPYDVTITDLETKDWYNRIKTPNGYQYRSGNGFDKNKSVPTIEGDEFEHLLNNTRGQSPQNPILLPSIQHVSNPNKTISNEQLNEYIREYKPKNKRINKWENGSIASYRKQNQKLTDNTRQDARTRQEGVPLNGKVYGTEKSPIHIWPEVTVVAEGRPEYHRQRGNDGGYHEWIAPYGSPDQIDLMDPANFIGPYKYTNPRGVVTYKQYISPNQMVPINSNAGERRFKRAYKKATPKSRKNQ